MKNEAHNFKSWHTAESLFGKPMQLMKSIKTLKKADRYNIPTYLLYNGLGIAVKLNDFTSITFIGFAFSHCMTFCYLFDKDNNVYVYNGK